MLTNIRRDLFRHLQRLLLAYHDNHIVGVTVSRVMNDVAEINELLSQGVITLIGDVIVLIGIVVIMLTMSPRLALITFTVLPLIAHRLNTVRNADWIYVLDQGQIVEQGMHADLLNRGELYAQLYARPFSG